LWIRGTPVYRGGSRNLKGGWGETGRNKKQFHPGTKLFRLLVLFSVFSDLTNFVNVTYMWSKKIASGERYKICLG